MVELYLFHDDIAVISFHFREASGRLVGIKEGRGLLRNCLGVLPWSGDENFSVLHYFPTINKYYIHFQDYFRFVPKISYFFRFSSMEQIRTVSGGRSGLMDV